MSSKEWLFAIALNGVYLGVLSKTLFITGTPDKNDLLIEILLGFQVYLYTFVVPVTIVLCIFFWSNVKREVHDVISLWLILSAVYLLPLWPLLAKWKDVAINNPGPVLIGDFVGFGIFGMFVILLWCLATGDGPNYPKKEGSWNSLNTPRSVSTWHNDSTGESGTIEHWD